MSNKLEQGPEHIPTVEEVRGVFDRMGKGEHTVTRLDRDSEGNPLVLHAVVPKDEQGFDLEFYYTRQTTPLEDGTQSGVATIHSTFFKDGVHIDGAGPEANLVNGEWIIVE